MGREEDTAVAWRAHGLFEGKTGAVIGGPPPRGLDPLPVKVEEGAVYVQYKAFRIGVPERAEA